MHDLDELRNDLFMKKIHLSIIITSFVLMFISIYIVILTGVYVPFVICLIIYMLSSFISTTKYTSLSRFFDWSSTPGTNGCITVPLYMIVYPIVSIISCFYGAFPLISQIKIVSKTIKELESNNKK